MVGLTGVVWMSHFMFSWVCTQWVVPGMAHFLMYYVSQEWVRWVVGCNQEDYVPLILALATSAASPGLLPVLVWWSIPSSGSRWRGQ